MSIALLVNGSTAPTSYQIGTPYYLKAQVDGVDPISVSWSLGRRGEAAVVGSGDVLFEPVAAEPYYLSLQVLKADGRLAEQIFVLATSAAQTATTPVSIIWDSASPAIGSPFGATIVVSDPLPARSISWVVLFNNVQIQGGSGTRVDLQVPQPGVVRLMVTLINFYGAVVQADSCVATDTPYCLQTAIVPPAPNTSLLFLGSVYTPLMESGETLCSYLPYELASLASVAKLPPGTTHFSVEVDPSTPLAPGEVVVRTKLGNWTLIGSPTGLTDEALPYDYQHGQPVQPAPLDLNAHYTIDAWNVHGVTAAAYRFRVRFKCYRVAPALYRYTPCDWSSYEGGFGQRQRRMVAVVTNVDVLLDAESPQNRGGSTAVESYTTPETTVIRGTFDRVQGGALNAYQDDHFYTRQNLAAVYESPSGQLSDFEVHAVYGTPDGLPSYLDFSQPGLPRIVNKPQRLWGKIMLYGAAGAFESGTVITARIALGAAPGYREVVLTVVDSVYNPSDSQYLKIAEAEIDLSDFEFDRVGLVITFHLDESNVQGQTPAYLPLAEPVMDAFYTSINAPAISVDTACFRDPVLVPVYEGTFAGSSTPLPDCNTLKCGPLGVYCYIEVGGTVTYNAAQPLGFPAPFIARVEDQAKCYGTPSLLYEQTSEHAGSNALLGYATSAGCGVPYRYVLCSGTGTLAVIFPVATSPHSVLQHAARCYSYAGTLSDLRAYTVATAADTTPVSGCLDVACTGSNSQGDTYAYQDLERQTEVLVSFAHASAPGFPRIGVAPQIVSSGNGLTPPGSYTYFLDGQKVFPLFTAAENADVVFHVGPASLRREIVLTRGAQRLHYLLGLGVSTITVPVQAGDSVALDLSRFSTTFRYRGGTVTWQKQSTLPRLYDTVTYAFSGSSTVRALGFTGLSERDDYAYYGTLPADVAQTTPNPDSAVTVQDSSGTEMLLVRTRAQGERPWSFDVPGYSGQVLSSPLTFRFYAGRSQQGAHGEMDVWLDSAGTAPEYFRVSPYKALVRGDEGYFRSSVLGATARRGLRVATATEATEYASPRVFSDARGARIVAQTVDDQFDYEGNTYIFYGTVDYGISDRILRVTGSTSVWLTEDGDPYLTEDTEAPWLS